MTRPTGPRGLRAHYNFLHGLSKGMDRAVKGDFLRGIRRFKETINPYDIAKAFGKLGRKPTEAALGSVVKTVSWEAMEKHLAPTAKRLGNILGAASTAAVKEIPRSDALRFSLKNPAMERYLSGRTGELITTSEKGMLEAVRAATTRVFTHGLSPAQVGDELRGSIGLNAPQARALGNYHMGLLGAEKPRPKEEIAKLVSAYEERLLDQRAILIGRTEVRFAQNAGQQQVWEEAHEQGLLPDDAMRIWVVDGKPCPEICLKMANKQVGLREPWRLPDGRDVHNPTESHPNCYCIAALSF